MEFRVLGPLEVVDEGQPLPLGGVKQRSLLAVLLQHANQVVSTDHLLQELWGEAPPATAAKSIQVYVTGCASCSGRSAWSRGRPGMR